MCVFFVGGIMVLLIGFMLKWMVFPVLALIRSIASHASLGAFPLAD